MKKGQWETSSVKDHPVKDHPLKTPNGFFLIDLNWETLEEGHLSELIGCLTASKYTTKPRGIWTGIWLGRWHLAP